jgi:arsenate reductase-like glutaredoxin family protein
VSATIYHNPHCGTSRNVLAILRESGAMLAHPILINRPIVVTPRGVKLCRPSETVRELLGA